MVGALRVLIVDENPADRALAARELAGEFPDIRVIEVADATDFETAMARGGFDLVITEFRLGWSDGLSVFRELKYRYPEIPVIMFTGAGSEEIAVEAMRAGLDDYVLKSPEHVARLSVVAAMALERARERQARTQAEEALHSSEAHLRALFASMSAVVLVLDRDGRYLEVAPTRPELLYRPAAETLGKTEHELFPPEQADAFLEAIRKALDTHATVEIEYMLQIRGEDMWFVASISPMLGDSVVWVARDITERKRAEAALRESEEEHRNLVERANDGITIVQDGTVRFANSRLAEMWGGGLDEIIGTPFTEYIHADALPAVVEYYKRRTAGEDVPPVYETVLRRKDGSRMPAELNAGMITRGGKSADLVVVRDVTERRKADEALRESEARYRSLFANMLEGFSYCRMVFEDDQPHDFIYLDVNSRFEELTGLKDVVGKRVTDVIPGIRESHPELFEIYGRVSLTGEPERFETYLDTVGWLSISVYCPGREHFVAVFDNITERREAEEKLQEERERALTYLDVAGVMMVVLDAEGQITLVNRKGREVLGYEEQELLNQNWFDLCLTAETREDVKRVFESLMAGDVAPVECFENKVLTKDGEERLIAFDNIVVRDQSSRIIGTLSSGEDITDRKQAEEELRHSHERIRELLGHLIRAQEDERARVAADIHDDSIQVMSAVGMRLEALRRRLHDPEALESLKPLEETVTLAIARLRHLMFELRPRVLDEEGLAPVLRMCLDDLSEQTKIECTLANRLGEEPPAAARTVLYRIAQEALANVRKHANAKRIDVVLEPRAGGYAVRITDDGSGFDPSAAEQTLPEHLGLATMRERAETSGGWWQIESTPGSGTTVEFWVPAEAD